MDVAVEVGIPVPAVRKSYKYPYHVMQVNESFKVDGVKLQTICNMNSRNGKRLGRKFIARKEGDGIRVWRVE